MNSQDIELSNVNQLPNDQMQEKSILKIDEIFNSISSWNKINMKVYLIILLVLMADGGEAAIISFLLPILEKEWKMNTFQKGFFGTCGAIGALFGGTISGTLSDHYGRKKIYIVGNILTALFGFLIAFSNGLFSYAILRMVYGFGVAMSITAASSLTTEISPKNIRAWILNIVWLFYPIGELYCALLADFYLVVPEKLDNKGNNAVLSNDFENWRKLMITVSIPCIICVFISIFVIESPRYYLYKKKYNEAFAVLNEILKGSNKNELTEDDKKQIIAESEIQGENLLTQENLDTSTTKIKKGFIQNIKELFNSEYKSITLLLSCIYLIIAFAWSGLSFIMPKAIKQKEQLDFEETGDYNDPHAPYVTFMISAICEIPCTLLSSYLAEHKSLGRKGSLMLTFLICSIPGLLICLPIPGFSVYFIIIKFIIVIPYSIIYIYNNEIYPTKIRSTALGLLGSFTRISAIISPFVMILLFDLYFYLPFAFIACLLVLGILFSYLLPLETLGTDIK